MTQENIQLAAGTHGISSMTGFGRATSTGSDGPRVTLTLKSINHRFLDLQFRLSSGAEALEPTLRSALKAAFVRGHIDCFLTVEREVRETIEQRATLWSFDEEALSTYLASYRAVSAEHNLSVEPDLNFVARIPGILVPRPTKAEAKQTPEEYEAWLNALLPGLLAEAIAALRKMRLEEGAALATILRAGLHRLLALVEEVGTLRAEVQSSHFDRLSARLQELIGQAADRDRIVTEAALIAERGDVEEELARLRTHIAQFHALLDGVGEAGKRLDFLLQELGREANTLLSKTAGLTGGGIRITDCGLLMKAEIEKLREQVQNLE